MLTNDQKIFLKKLALDTIKSHFMLNDRALLPKDEAWLLEKKALFVTIKKGSSLRGCIGNLYPVDKLFDAVQKMALAASFNDYRFTPLSQAELSEISIEISILSAFQKIEDYQEIILGKHGLLIKHYQGQGLLLPQVATENNWDRANFLQAICRKAGLDYDKLDAAELFIFTAEVF